MKIMKKILNHVENFIIALFFVLVIHNVTFKPKRATKSAQFLLTFSVLLCSAESSVILMCLNGNIFKMYLHFWACLGKF